MQEALGLGRDRRSRSRGPAQGADVGTLGSGVGLGRGFGGRDRASARASGRASVRASGRASVRASASVLPSAWAWPSAWRSGAPSVSAWSSGVPWVAGSRWPSRSARPSAWASHPSTARALGSRRPSVSRTAMASQLGTATGKDASAVGLGGAGVPVTDSTPPSLRGQIANAATATHEQGRRRERSLARHGRATRPRRHDRARGDRVGLAIRQVPGRVRCGGAGHDEPRRSHDSGPEDARTPTILLGRFGRSQAARARSARPSARVEVGRPSAFRTRYIPIEASTMSAAPASTPGRWACEARPSFPLPFPLPAPVRCPRRCGGRRRAPFLPPPPR